MPCLGLHDVFVCELVLLGKMPSLVQALACVLNSAWVLSVLNLFFFLFSFNFFFFLIIEFLFIDMFILNIYWHKLFFSDHKLSILYAGFNVFQRHCCRAHIQWTVFFCYIHSGIFNLPVTTIVLSCIIKTGMEWDIQGINLIMEQDDKMYFDEAIQNNVWLLCHNSNSHWCWYWDKSLNNNNYIKFKDAESRISSSARVYHCPERW